MTEGEPRPRPKRVSTALAVIPQSPLDESGFFRNGKVHDKIHNAVTCGCPNCGQTMRREIARGGVFREAEVEMVVFRYQNVANKVHQIRLKGN